MTKRMQQLALIGVPVLVLAGALMVWLQGGRHITTENAFVKADIAQIASEVPGRIIELRIRDHAVVAAGDMLIRLDPATLSVGARESRSRNRFRACRCRATQGQPARDPGRGQRGARTSCRIFRPRPGASASCPDAA